MYYYYYYNLQLDQRACSVRSQRLGQYANSPHHRVDCYTELAVFFIGGSLNRIQFHLSTEG